MEDNIFISDDLITVQSPDIKNCHVFFIHENEPFISREGARVELLVLGTRAE